MPFHLKAVHAPVYKHAQFYTVSHTVIDIVILDLFHTKALKSAEFTRDFSSFQGEKASETECRHKKVQLC